MTALVIARSEDVAALAEVHANAFAAAWTAKDLDELFATPGTTALTAVEAGSPVGFILIRTIIDEAEVLTLAVQPASQRRGIGAALVDAAAAAAEAAGAATLWLEVAADNLAAMALYRSAGFQAAGCRRGYYRREGGEAQDALLFRRVLNRPAASAYAAPP